MAVTLLDAGLVATLDAYKISIDKITDVKSKTEPTGQVAQKKEYLKIVKKVARRVCCGDQEYSCWIMEKLSKYTKDGKKNVDLELYYDKSDKTPLKKRYFGCAIIRDIGTAAAKSYDAKKMKAPKKNKNDKCAVPNMWCEDDTKELEVVVIENGPATTQINKNYARAEKITFIMKNESKSAIAMLELLKTAKKRELKCYQNEFNMNLCKKLALIPIERKYEFADKYLETGKLNKIPVRLSCINLNLYGPFDYISAGKGNLPVVRNLVLFPGIDKFYAHNPHLVSSSIKNEMKTMACCYDLVKKRTGYCYFSAGYVSSLNIVDKQKEIFDAGSFRAIATADAVALT
jgi:hypothetical protein